MSYSLSELTSIKSKIFAKISHEIELANRNNEMNELLDKYGITFEEEWMPINTRTYRIMVLGELAGNKSDYIIAAKRLGISENNLEFVSYVEAKHLNAARLEYSDYYSDIVLGPIPHKVSGMGDTSSLVAAMEHEPKKYPKLVKAIANSSSEQLKFSITTFKDCLTKTRYYEALIEE